MRSRKNKTGAVTLILLVAVILLALYREAAPSNPPPPAPTPAGEIGWIEVYFSDPAGPNARSLRGGPDADLAEAIANARLSVDIAAYDLDLWSLRDALIAAQRRGVSVRMVIDSDYHDTPEIQELVEAGLPLLGDRREGLMHNKFVVIDRQEVWTGSMNFTVNDTYRNNNNLVRVRSTQLAENYTREFEEMFVGDAFGPRSPADTPYQTLSVDGTLLEVYFSPEDETASRLVELIAGAQQSLYFLAFSFTADDIAEVVIARHQAGVSVQGVLDTGQASANTGGEYENLLQAGLELRLDGNPNRMHHKLFIIDGAIVVTGSYNFSRSAETRNDENTLVIHNPEIAALFLAEFERLFAQAQP